MDIPHVAQRQVSTIIHFQLPSRAITKQKLDNALRKKVRGRRRQRRRRATSRPAASASAFLPRSPGRKKELVFRDRYRRRNVSAPKSCNLLSSFALPLCPLAGKAGRKKELVFRDRYRRRNVTAPKSRNLLSSFALPLCPLAGKAGWKRWRRRV